MVASAEFIELKTPYRSYSGSGGGDCIYRVRFVTERESGGSKWRIRHPFNPVYLLPLVEVVAVEH